MKPRKGLMTRIEATVGPAEDQHQAPTNGLNIEAIKEVNIAFNRRHADCRMISMMYPTFL